MSNLTEKTYIKYFARPDIGLPTNIPTFERCKKLEEIFRQEFSEFTDEQIIFFMENQRKLEKIFEFPHYDLFTYLLKNKM